MPSTKIFNILRTDKFEDILKLFRETPADEVIFVLPKRTRAFSLPAHFERLAEVSSEIGKYASFLTPTPEIQALASAHNFATLVATGRLDNRGRKPSSGTSPATPKAEPTARLAIKRDDYTGEVVDDSTSDEDEAGELGYRIGTDVGTTDGTDDDLELGSSRLEVKEHDDEGENTEHQGEKGDLSELETENKDDQPDEDQFDTVAFNRQPIQSETEPEYEIITAAKINRTLSDIVRPEPEETRNLKISRHHESAESVRLQRESGPSSLNQHALDEIKSVWQNKGLWSRDAVPTKRKAKAAESPLKFLMPDRGDPLRPSSRRSADSTTRRVVTTMIVLAAVLLGVTVYLITGSAKVTIEPKRNSVDFSLKLVAADSYDTVDIKTARLPGQTFEINRQGEESRTSSGERDVAQKARGTITIYNEYGTAPQPLIATTRFESENGLVFRTLTTVTVPGTKVENGQITPGSTTVEVIADKPGDTYNIGPGQFRIAAFREKGDTDRYQKFHAVSTSAMKGGVVGKAKVVTESDFAQARQALEERLKNEAHQAIESQSSGLRIIYTSEPAIQSFETTAKVDEAADQITASARASVTAVGIKEDDLYNILNQYLQQIGGWTSPREFLKVELTGTTRNPTTGTVEFVAQVRGDAFSVIETSAVRQELIGQTRDEVAAYLRDHQGISSAHVVLSPFWVRRVPTDETKVSVEVSYTTN